MRHETSAGGGAQRKRIFRARLLLSPAQPVIENAAMAIEGETIHAVGRWPAISAAHSGEVTDLAETILLPGLINAHCHLDYTAMAGLLPPPKRFPDWIKSLLSLKAHWSYSEYADSWLKGARMLVQNGTTTVADIEAVPELIPDLWADTPLRVYTFFELTGVRGRRPAREILAETTAKIETLPKERNWTGLSPHAPYSTTGELLVETAKLLEQRAWQACMHVAESLEEFQMFSQAEGEMFRWLKSQREMNDCGLGSPVQLLDRCGLLSRRLTAVHVNYLAGGDAELLGQAGVSVVHCPSSHNYFQHRPFPRDELERAGVNIALGTDSLASTRAPKTGALELSLFREMQLYLEGAPALDPREALRATTTQAAQALGLSDRVGDLAPGLKADAVAVPYSGRPAQAVEAAVFHSGPVAASLIGGVWAGVLGRD